MNRNFRDTKQKIFVKVLSTARKAERELIGSNVFGAFVGVPQIIKLDTKTLAISQIRGSKAIGLRKDVLSNLIIDLICEINSNFTDDVVSLPTIFEEIAVLIQKFFDNPEILASLEDIEKSLVRARLFPVHGDLQKQNIFLQKEKVSLIDFEHFMFAPQELDIVNSLFFKDQNCLDAVLIIKKLVTKNIFDMKMIEYMLVFYAIKQMAAGRGKKECQKRLQAGIEKLKEVIKDKKETDISDVVFLS